MREKLGCFTWVWVGSGIAITLLWLESLDPLLFFFAPSPVTGDFTGLRVLRSATSGDRSALAGEASESVEWLRGLFWRSSSSDDVDLSRLLLLLTGLLWRLDADDDDEERELWDELLEIDFFLFSSSGDFSDLRSTLSISLYIITTNYTHHRNINERKLKMIHRKRRKIKQWPSNKHACMIIFRTQC